MYLTKEQLADGSQSVTLSVGETANVVLTEYAPFQSKAGKTIPKHKAKNADTGAELEFVGYSFHSALAPMNDHIVPGVTVLKVSCLDSGTTWPDYSIEVVLKGTTSTDDAF